MNNNCGGFLLLCEKIDNIISQKEELIVAIDGPCGSGKSTLASMLAKAYKANVFHLDDYFLTPELRSPERLKELGGNVDYERFRQEVIQGIDKKEAFSYFRYNCKRDEMEKIGVDRPTPLTVIEGSYSLNPYLIESYGLKIFLEIEPELQRERILKRNGPRVAKEFFNKWIPLEDLYFKDLAIKNQADIVLDGGLIDVSL